MMNPKFEVSFILFNVIQIINTVSSAFCNLLSNVEGRNTRPSWKANKAKLYAVYVEGSILIQI